MTSSDTAEPPLRSSKGPVQGPRDTKYEAGPVSEWTGLGPGRLVQLLGPIMGSISAEQSRRGSHVDHNRSGLIVGGTPNRHMNQVWKKRLTRVVDLD